MNLHVRSDQLVRTIRLAGASALVACTALLVFPGCGNAKVGPAPSASASSKSANLTAQWDVNNGKLTIPELGATGKAVPAVLGFTVSYEKLPPGAKVKIDDHEDTVPASGSYSGTVNLADEIGELFPASAFSLTSDMEPRKSIHLTFEDGATLDVRLPRKSVRPSLQLALAQLKTGTPLLFGKEADAVAKEHRLIYVDGFELTLLSPVVRLKDVDWIAVSEEHPEKDAGKTCPGLKGAADQKQAMPLSTIDTTVVIYDRRAGKPVDKKDFTAKPECPPAVNDGKAIALSSRGGPIAHVDGKQVTSWLEEKQTK